jgi:hypothetical protein
MRNVFLCLLSALLSGCVVLPIPHTSPAGYDYHGQVVDARTRRPLAGAKVRMDDRPRSSVVTEADGKFAVSAGSHFHLLYYANPSWSAGIPPGLTYSKVLLIEKPGYRSFRWDPHSGANTQKAVVIRWQQDNLPDRRLNRTTIFLKPIGLQPVSTKARE